MAFNVKEWRLLKEKTIEEMANECGVHWNTYKAWEANPEKITIENSKKIANALQVPLNSIIFASTSTICSHSTK